MNFKINSRPLFTIIFRLKNDNFKTHDFSPHIERVLAGVFSNYFAMLIIFSQNFFLLSIESCFIDQALKNLSGTKMTNQQLILANLTLNSLRAVRKS